MKAMMLEPWRLQELDVEVLAWFKVATAVIKKKIAPVTRYK